jgi:uncharacterized membrane protein
MEKQKLPNATAVLILGIVSLITCCCWGAGIVLAIVALVLAKKDMAMYRQEPELYGNYSTLNTGRILAIIGIVLGVIALIAIIYIKVNFTQEQILEWQHKMSQMK